MYHLFSIFCLTAIIYSMTKGAREIIIVLRSSFDWYVTLYYSWLALFLLNVLQYSLLLTVFRL